MAACWSLAFAARAQEEAPPETWGVAVVEPEDLGAEPLLAEWRWRQILASPRIGGRLTSVTVDPTDSRVIYVGTEEGTVVRSFDAGVTWDEVELDPFVLSARTGSLSPIPRPAPTDVALNPLQIIFDPPFARFLHRVALPSVPLPQYQTLPENMAVFFTNPSQATPTELLDSVTRDNSYRTRPVRRIAVCGGTEYPLLVGTKNDLYGSPDRGETYVRLFGLPGTAEILDLRCDLRDPRHVLLGTTFGLYRSTDGGLSFDLVLAGIPQLATGATAFMHGPRGDAAYAAYGVTLFRGDPNVAEGLAYAFPNFDNVETAPWGAVQWIETTSDGDVWVATDDGVRHSSDDGVTFRVVDRTLFDRQKILQVLVGRNERGGKRVVILSAQWIYASDDGETFQPFFLGGTRRSLAQMAFTMYDGEPRYFVVSGGELFSTASTPQAGGDPSDRRWAEARLASTPPLDAVMNLVLGRNGLAEDQLADLFSRATDRAYAPRIDASFRLVNDRYALSSVQNGTGPNTLLGSADRTNWELFVQATFYFRDAAYAPEQVSFARNQLHELQRQIGFVAEDAWHERRLLLRRIASGETDLAQTEILKERIAALEAILETWARQRLHREPTEG